MRGMLAVGGAGIDGEGLRVDGRLELVAHLGQGRLALDCADEAPLDLQVVACTSGPHQPSALNGDIFGTLMQCLPVMLAIAAPCPSPSDVQGPRNCMWTEEVCLQWTGEVGSTLHQHQ